MNRSRIITEAEIPVIQTEQTSDVSISADRSRIITSSGFVAVIAGNAADVIHTADRSRVITIAEDAVAVAHHTADIVASGNSARIETTDDGAVPIRVAQYAADFFDTADRSRVAAAADGAVTDFSRNAADIFITFDVTIGHLQVFHASLNYISEQTFKLKHVIDIDSADLMSVTVKRTVKIIPNPDGRPLRCRMLPV